MFDFVLQIIEIIDDDDSSDDAASNDGEQKAQSQEDKKCCVCKTEAPVRVMIACGHVCICNVCHRNLTENAEKEFKRINPTLPVNDETMMIICPLCRTPAIAKYCIRCFF